MSAPHITPADPAIDALVSEAATMERDIEAAAERCTTHEQSLAGLKSESDTLLSEDATPAMDTLLVLVRRIELLYKVTQGRKSLAALPYRILTLALGTTKVRTKLVKSCKSQSRVVYAHFQSLSEKASDLTRRYAELTTDLTYEISLAQERIGRIQNMTQDATSLRNGVEGQREGWQGKKTTADEHMRQAKETIQSARSKRKSIQSARALRNILTLGLGEAFDFFSLNEEINGAKKTITTAKENVRACEESIQQAMAALQRIKDEVERLNKLGHRLDAQKHTLHGSVTNGQALRARAIDLTNASLDVSLFVGELAANSETLAVHHTAQEFAQGVLKFGRLTASDKKLKKLLMRRDPVALQGTLDMIARSGPVNDSSRSVGTQKPRFAIENAM